MSEESNEHSTVVDIMSVNGKDENEFEQQNDDATLNSIDHESISSLRKRKRATKISTPKERVLKMLKESWLPEVTQYSSETSSDESETEEPTLLFPKHTKRRETILCYGDSLTWGMAHNYTGRYEVTWPRILKQMLKGLGFRVAEAGLCSRTTCFDDPDNHTWMTGARPHFFNGLQHFTSEFISAQPDILVLLLGTNDVKTSIRKLAKARTRVDASVVAANCAQVANKARELARESAFFGAEPKIIIVAPPEIKYCGLSKNLGYDDSSAKIASDFNETYRRMCESGGFIFVENPVVAELSLDGIHFTPEANEQIARGVATAILGEMAPNYPLEPLENIRDKFVNKQSNRTKFAEGEVSSIDSFSMLDNCGFYSNYSESTDEAFSVPEENSDDEEDHHPFLSLGEFKRFGKAADDSILKDHSSTERRKGMIMPSFDASYGLSKSTKSSDWTDGTYNIRWYSKGRPSYYNIMFRPIGTKLIQDMYEMIEKRLEAEGYVQPVLEADPINGSNNSFL